MQFKPEQQIFSPHKYASYINELTIGSSVNEIKIGGENVLPFYTFDAPIKNSPKIGVAITDSGYYKLSSKRDVTIKQNRNIVFTGLPDYDEYFDGAETLVDVAKKAAVMPGVDFLTVYLIGAHPDKGNKSPEECASLVKDISNAVDIPLVVMGCNNPEKDATLLEKVSEFLFGKNVLILSAREENYKTIAAAAGLAYSHKIGAESAVDVNLAKQLNVLISQMGVKPQNMVMDIGSAAAGYGFDYIISTIDRVKLAALEQNDTMLQMPIITPVFTQAWFIKESTASEEDYPEWGDVEVRGINMEIATAAANLAAGSNAVILMHPKSVETIAGLIKELI